MGVHGYLPTPLTNESIERIFQHICVLFTHIQRAVVIVETDGDITQHITDWLCESHVRILSAGQESAIEALLNADSLKCTVINLTKEPRRGVRFLNFLTKYIHSPLLPVLVYTEEALTKDLETTLKTFEETFILKKVSTQERLLDEISLFLHLKPDDLPKTQQKMLEVLHPEQATLKGKRILLMDNDMRNVFILSGELEKYGATVLVADNAEDVMKQLHSASKIDILLLRIGIPDMDEYELLKHIRIQRQFERLPVIVMKKNGVRGERRRYMKIGANEYISTPLETSKLLSLLRVWLY